MANERLPMRKIRDVLRLDADGLSRRKIAASLVIGRTTVREYLIKTLLAGAEDLFASKNAKTRNDGETEIKELHAKIGELTVDIDFF